MPLLLIGAPFSFAGECTVVRLPAHWEAPLVSTLENSLDFLSLRLLTTMRPIFLLYLNSSNYSLGWHAIIIG